MVIEKQGNFYAHHMYQIYQPSEDEWKNAGVSPMKLDFDFDFPQISGSSESKDRSYKSDVTKGSGTKI
jgi:hypothetical protein